MEISDLEPQNVWQVFEQITKVPRPSRHEEKIRSWVLQWADEHNFKHAKDEYGNIVVYKNATPGHENAPTVVLQGHLDMVCVNEPNKEIDFLEEGLDAYIDGDYVTAKGTTLGADNGIGMAINMGLLIGDFEHGPLELLLTVEEEIGLFGAAHLDASMLHGKLLFNVDAGGWGVMTVGCAGGGDTIIQKKITLEPLTNAVGFKIEIGPLNGGHSGVSIHEPRANAIKLLSRILKNMMTADVQLVSFEGGIAHNAIPSSAFLEIAFSAEHKHKVQQIYNRVKDELEHEWVGVEDLNLQLTQTTPSSAVDLATTKQIADALFIAPHGVIRFHPKIANLVETSTNLAKINISDSLIIEYSTRSSVMSELENTRLQIATLFAFADSIQQNPAYPGWEPNLNTDWFKLVKANYSEVLGEEPVVEAVHAGLEAGVIGSKISGMEMVAIGPTIYDEHAPTERVEIATVGKIYEVMKITLQKLL